MGKTQPIRNVKDIERLKEYFLKKDQFRNYALITLALNTSLRIGDLLTLRWEDVYNFKREVYQSHIKLIEQKTGKNTIIAINKEAKKALDLYRKSEKEIFEKCYIFTSRIGQNRPIGRICAFRLIKNAARDLNMEGLISCHSLRKTFGYHAWKKGVPPALIMAIYNHSSLEITKRYLCIDQDDKDGVFLEMNL